MTNDFPADSTPGASGTVPAGPAAAAIAATRTWVERAVIGLNLCPFARAAHTGGKIRYVMTAAPDTGALIDALAAELEHLAEASPDEIETTLLIHPHVLQDFLDYNDFLEVADELVERLGLEGVVQVASFHPRYQFERTKPDDIENYTNRSPHPTLHLLREDSVERAVNSHPDADAIPLRNIETLKRIGIEGWKQLRLATPPDPTAAIGEGNAGRIDAGE